MHKPSHFLLNDQGNSLTNELATRLVHANRFDIITGYLRITGISRFIELIAKTDKTRIIFGLGVDKNTVEASFAASNESFNLYSSYESIEEYENNIINELNENIASEAIESSLKSFINLLKSDCANSQIDQIEADNGKLLEIRLHKSRKLHAKLYILRYPDQATKGCVITGSSNFSQSGLEHNLEFNVLLPHEDDLNYALYRFDELWKDSIDIKEALLETIEKKTWIRNDITPYQLYLKTLYHYFQEDINTDLNVAEYEFPHNFMKLQYQIDAAKDIVHKIEKFNGVFIADVVGLGKTYITAMVLQQLKAKSLIICPPVLKENWEDALHDFGVRSSKVESLGKLSSIISRGLEKYEYIVVDESHRFRNQGTEMYDQLKKICMGKKVILVSATPINNRISDVQGQLLLFQSAINSTIPAARNLDSIFSNYKRLIDTAQKELRDAKEIGEPIRIKQAVTKQREVVKQVANEVRDKILHYVMVRRTRTDIKKHFSSDIKKQGLHFPIVKDPARIVYTFSGDTETAFNHTIEMLKSYGYFRYIPLLYLKNRELSTFQIAAQRNIGGFMKGLLVKRLESSFTAFRMSIDRFIRSADKFVAMFDSGVVYVGKESKLFDALDSEDFEMIDRWISEGDLEEFKASDFHPTYIKNLRADIKILKAIQQLWQPISEDPKLSAFISQLAQKQELQKQIVVFTESIETAEYLYAELNKVYSDQVLFYHHSKAIRSDKRMSKQDGLELIRHNFDPREKIQKNDVRILVTTDVLAEGVNLHRSNVIVNYDLPWNPTRVLQRVGRINRIGSSHDHVHIFNFFPTTQSDSHIGLEENITRKIQLFHDILGEDAKYLFDDEETGSQELFNKLSKAKTYEGDTEEDSTLPYLHEIRRVRDEQPELFALIKSLPPQIRCAYVPQFDKAGSGLITFFREGLVKRFFKATAQGEATELTFLEAIRQLQVPPDHVPIQLPEVFYSLLDKNKSAFVQRSQEAAEGGPLVSGRGKGNSLLRYLIPVVREAKKYHQDRLTDSDARYFDYVLQTLAESGVGQKTQQRLKAKLTERVVQGSLPDLLDLLRKEVPYVETKAMAPRTSPESGPKGIILSAALLER